MVGPTETSTNGTSHSSASASSRRQRDLSPQSAFAPLALLHWLTEHGRVKDPLSCRDRIWRTFVGAISDSSTKLTETQAKSADKSPPLSENTNQVSKSTSSTNCASIRSVPDLPRVVYELFDSKFVLCTSRVIEEQFSEHGGKLVIELQNKQRIETVIIHHSRQPQNDVEFQGHHADDVVFDDTNGDQLTNYTNYENEDPSKNFDKTYTENTNGSKSTNSGVSRHRLRTTVCVSSQVGCAMGCTFCATGTMGLMSNLTAAEIMEQIYHANCRATVSNVVFMGMGEPLDNCTAVLEAIQSIPSAFPGIGSMRRITVSTVGIPRSIKLITEACPTVQLALSLHAPNDSIRKQLVPTAKAYSLKKIMEAVDFYLSFNDTDGKHDIVDSNIFHGEQLHQRQSLQTVETATPTTTVQSRASSKLIGRRTHNNGKRQRRWIMIEYIMIDGINSSIDCANELRQLLQGRNSFVNLIPYNPTAAGDRYSYSCPSDETMIAFRNAVLQSSSEQPHSQKQCTLKCSIRWSSRRGQSIGAACGQLVLQRQHQQLQPQPITDDSSSCYSIDRDGPSREEPSKNKDIEDILPPTQKYSTDKHDENLLSSPITSTTYYNETALNKMSNMTLRSKNCSNSNKPIHQQSKNKTELTSNRRFRRNYKVSKEYYDNDDDDDYDTEVTTNSSSKRSKVNKSKKKSSSISKTTSSWLPSTCLNFATSTLRSVATGRREDKQSKKQSIITTSVAIVGSVVVASTLYYLSQRRQVRR